MVGPQTGRYLYHTPWVDTNEYIGHPKPVGLTDGTIIGQLRKSVPWRRDWHLITLLEGQGCLDTGN